MRLSTPGDVLRQMLLKARLETDAATMKTVIHHDAGSTVFETNYANEADRIDLFAIVTDEAQVVTKESTSPCYDESRKERRTSRNFPQ
jgi:hypothetical protein